MCKTQFDATLLYITKLKQLHNVVVWHNERTAMWNLVPELLNTPQIHQRKRMSRQTIPLEPGVPGA